MSEREQLVDERPGPFAWAVIVFGWVLMAVAVAGAIGDERLRGLGSWATWIVGAALVHDLVVLPVVLTVGWLVTRWVPMPWRVPLRTALAVSAVLTVTVWPIARRWGARADNPSIVPLPVARNLTWIVVALFVTALGVGAVSAARARARAETPPTEDLA